MELAVFIVVIFTASVTGAPDAPVILENLSHTILLEVKTADVPKNTNIVQLQAQEMDDLTGNRFEEGYKFGYNAAYPLFYYPQVDSGKYEIFRVRYTSDAGESWGEWSESTKATQADKSRVELRNTKRNFRDAEDLCLEEGKRLAVIHGEGQNAKLRAMLNGNPDDNSPAFIGLFDANYDNAAKSKPDWKWVDDSRSNFKKFEWGSDFEENSSIKSSVVAINVEGEWERVDPKEKRRFFCEGGKEEKPDKKQEQKRGIDTFAILKETLETLQ